MKPCKHALETVPVCDKCRRSRQHDAKRKEARREYKRDNNKKRYDKNAEGFRAYRRRYYEANKEEVSRKAKIARDAHPEKGQASGKRWRESRPEYVKELSKKWYAENKETARHNAKKHRARQIGMIGFEWLGRLSEYQQGRCAVCDQTPTQSLHLDHDHNTMLVRGLLCSGCNVGNGITDSIELLRKKIAYLENPPAKSLGLWG